MTKSTKRTKTPSAAKAEAQAGGFSEAGATFVASPAAADAASDGAPPAPPSRPPRKIYRKIAGRFLAAQHEAETLQKDLWQIEDEGRPTTEIEANLQAASSRCREAEKRFAAEPARNHSELDFKLRALALAEGYDEETLFQCGPLFPNLLRSAMTDLRRLPARTSIDAPTYPEASEDELEGASPATVGMYRSFERLYADWALALGALHDPDRWVSDEDSGRLDGVYRAAELALLTAPSPRSWGIWKKWEILDTLVTEGLVNGDLEDKRVVVALGAIKADLIRFLK